MAMENIVSINPIAEYTGLRAHTMLMAPKIAAMAKMMKRASSTMVGLVARRPSPVARVCLLLLAVGCRLSARAKPRRPGPHACGRRPCDYTFVGGASGRRRGPHPTVGKAQLALVHQDRV